MPQPPLTLPKTSFPLLCGQTAPRTRPSRPPQTRCFPQAFPTPAGSYIPRGMLTVFIPVLFQTNQTACISLEHPEQPHVFADAVLRGKLLDEAIDLHRDFERPGFPRLLLLDVQSPAAPVLDERGHLQLQGVPKRLYAPVTKFRQDLAFYDLFNVVIITLPRG